MKGRKVIFTFLFLIFIIIGGYFVVLSQGLTIDFDDWRIVKTGAIFLSVKPNGTELEIDGQSRKFKKSTLSFFNNGALIEKLTPEEHLVRIFKEGFRDWQKLVGVEPGLVTEFEKIILIPQEIISTTTEGGGQITDFWLTAKGVISRRQNELFFEAKPLKGEKVILADPNSTLIVSETGKGIYFLSDLSDLASTINLTELFNSLKQRQLSLPGTVPLKELTFHPFSDSKIIIRTNAALYNLDIKKIKLELVSLFENILTQTTGANEVLLADSHGNLFFYNLLLKNKTIKESNLDGIKQIKTNDLNTKIGLLTNEEELFLYDRTKNGSLSEPLEGVRDLYFSPDNRHLLIFTSDEKIKIIDLGKNKVWFLDLPKGEIKNLTILPAVPEYFMALVNDQLIVSEIYAGEPLNWYRLEDKIKKYQLWDGVLYLLKENGELLKLEVGKWW